jgi:restriction endonuclease S subunit
MDLILSLMIPLPPIEEQQKIVDKLETILPLIENI